MLDAYSIHDIQIKRVAPGAWQEPGKTTIASLIARVSETDKRVLTTEGAEVQAAFKVSIGYAELQRVFSGSVDLYYSDIIIYDGSEYSILEMNKDNDFSPQTWVVTVR